MNGVFEKLPYTNFHELNLNWILKKIKQLENSINQLTIALAALDARVEALENIINPTDDPEV